MVKVSVIVPAYNTESYIKECVESLLNQTLKEVEVIVVDDGSKDHTLDVLREYEAKFPDKMKVFAKENGGQSSDRNLALKHAQGEFVGFVDSDDWVDLNMYELMYEKAMEEGSDIVVCDMAEHYTDKIVKLDFTSVPNRLAFAGSSCNKIFRRQMVGDAEFPVGLWYEDFDFSAKMLMKAKRISTISEGLYHYNYRPGSTMRNNNAQKNKDILTVLNSIHGFARENGWEEKYQEELEYLYIDHILLTSINRLEEQENPEKREVINFLRKEVLKRYPHFYKDKVFGTFASKRRIIAVLNGMGCSQISKLIFSLKKKKG